MINYSSNSLRIRRAEHFDLNFIVEIWLNGQYSGLKAKSFNAEQVSSYFSAKLDSQSEIFGLWVAEHDCQVVGWQGLQPCRNNPAYANIVAESSTYISHSSRRKGVGVALLNFAQHHATKVGVRQLRGHISITNAACLKLVEALGWQRIGIFPEIGGDIPALYLYSYDIHISHNC